MPQMSPYNWLILFIMFNMILLLIINFTHYMNHPSLAPMPYNKSILYKIKFTWKW